MRTSRGDSPSPRPRARAKRKPIHSRPPTGRRGVVDRPQGPRTAFFEWPPEQAERHCGPEFPGLSCRPLESLWLAVAEVPEMVRESRSVQGLESPTED